MSAQQVISANECARGEEAAAPSGGDAAAGPRCEEKGVAGTVEDARKVDSAIRHKGSAIIVPYRDLHPEQKRDVHLREFLSRIPRLLSGHECHIYIIEQSDDGRKFNRGKLLNVGFTLAADHDHDVFVFHDVDLVPSADLVPCYTQCPLQPVHIARVWQRYNKNPNYIGGAIAFSGSDFRRINGFPNTFWGWGGEDDEMKKRLEEEGIRVSAPPGGGHMEDLEGQDLQSKLQTLRQHREWKCNVKWEVLNEHGKTWRTNGLADLDYELLSTTSLAPHATKYTVDVKLNNHWTDSVFEPSAESSTCSAKKKREPERHGDQKRPRQGK